MEFPPSKKVTLPVGMLTLELVGATEALHCTDWPRMGCGDTQEIVIVWVALLSVTVNGALVAVV